MSTTDPLLLGTEELVAQATGHLGAAAKFLRLVEARYVRSAAGVHHMQEIHELLDAELDVHEITLARLPGGRWRCSILVGGEEFAGEGDTHSAAWAQAFREARGLNGMEDWR